MDPVAFNLLGLEIRWYAIFIVIGILIASYIAVKNTYKNFGDKDLVYDYAMYALPLGILGARLYYCLFKMDYYKEHLIEILNIRKGGLAIHGGLIAGLIVAYVFTKKRELNFFKFMDSVVVGVPLAQAIGRWGNYVNKEAYGSPTNLPWGIMIDGQKMHPTFLYESIWNVGVFILLLVVSRKRKFDGQLMALYLILYSLGRFFIESLRMDSLYLGPIRVAQLISLAMIIAGIIVYKVQSTKDIESSR